MLTLIPSLKAFSQYLNFPKRNMFFRLSISLIIPKATCKQPRVPYGDDYKFSLIKEVSFLFFLTFLFKNS